MSIWFDGTCHVRRHEWYETITLLFQGNWIVWKGRHMDELVVLVGFLSGVYLVSELMRSDCEDAFF